jgi:hypothetical protein
MTPLLTAMQATAVEPLPEQAAASTVDALAAAATAPANSLDLLELVL